MILVIVPKIVFKFVSLFYKFMVPAFYNYEGSHFMNKILRTLTFTFGLITITNCAFSMRTSPGLNKFGFPRGFAFPSRCAIDRCGYWWDPIGNKEERIRKLRYHMQESKGGNEYMFYSYDLMCFLDSHEEEFNEEFNQKQNLLSSTEAIKAQLQYTYSQFLFVRNQHGLLNKILDGIFATNFEEILDQSVFYIWNHNLFNQPVREQIMELICDVKANPEQLAIHSHQK